MLVGIAEAGETILAPAISAAAGHVVGEIVPGVAMGAVILADRAPLAFAQVGTPAAPVGLFLAVFLQALTSIAHGHTALAVAATLRQLVDLVKLDAAAAASLRELVDLAVPTRTPEDGRGATR